MSPVLTTGLIGYPSGPMLLGVISSSSLKGRVGGKALKRPMNVAQPFFLVSFLPETWCLTLRTCYLNKDTCPPFP